VLPSLGVGSLSAREAEGRANIATGDKVCIVSYTYFALQCKYDLNPYICFIRSTCSFYQECSIKTLIILCDSQEAHKLLQPVDNTLKTMALEFAEYQA